MMVLSTQIELFVYWHINAMPNLLNTKIVLSNCQLYICIKINMFNYCFFFHLNFFTAAVGFLIVSSAVTMSAPFFLGKVIDTIYTNSAADLTASLSSLCIMLAGVFLCGGAANAARVYLIHISGELSAGATIRMNERLNERNCQCLTHSCL